MKILHLALLAPGEPNLSPSRVMRELGHEVREIDWIKYRENHGLSTMRRHIVAINDEFKADVVFMQIQAPDIIDNHTAERLKRNSFVINWTGDVRTDISWYEKLAPSVSLTAFTNETDMQTLKHKGFNAGYIQTGYDELIFNEKGEKGSFPDIVFLGNSYVYAHGPVFPLSMERVEMVKALSNAFPQNFQVYGANWINTRHLKPEEEAMCYRSAKIAINQNHFDYRKFSSDRILRIMGCGCFCLTKYFEGIEDEYTIGLHLDTWNSFPELVDKIEYYLGNGSEERKVMALAGMKHVQENYTWHGRIKEVERIYNEAKQIA
jgi:spore maturation protein CgeB